MERQGLACVVNLVEERRGLDLEEILQHRVTEYVSLFNSNGTMGKTQKSKLVRIMNLVPTLAPRMYIAIMNIGSSVVACSTKH